MGTHTRILLVNCSPYLIDKIKKEGSRNGHTSEFHTVSDPDQLSSAIDRFNPDILICNYPGSKSRTESILSLTRSRSPYLSFVVVSEQPVEEEILRHLLDQGISEFLLVDHINRLGIVLKHAREKSELRKELFKKEQELLSCQDNQKQTVSNLNDRLKGQSCLFKVARIDDSHMSLATLLNHCVHTIPEGMQYPEITQACISYGDKEYHTRQFRESEWTLTSRSMTCDGDELRISVIYQEERPEQDRGPFLHQEQELLDSITAVVKLKIDRMEAKRVQKEKQRFVDKAFEVARIGYWEYHTDSKELHWAPTVKKIHEVEPDYEPSLDKLEAFYEPSFMDKMRAELNKASLTGKPYHLELQITTGKGKTRWIHLTGEPVMEHKKVRTIYGTIQDITERVVMQKELEEKETRLESAITGGDLGVWEIDYRTGENKVNDRWFEMLGYRPDPEKGTFRFFYSIIHPEDRHLPAYHAKRIENGGRNYFSYIIRIKSKSGKYKHILNRGSIVEFDENGKAVRSIGTHLDMSNFIELQKEHKDNEFRLDAALNGADLGVWDADLKSGNIYVNDRWLKMLGYRHREEANSLDFLNKIMHPEDREIIYDEVKRIQDGGRNSFENTLRLKNANGKYIYVLNRGKVAEFDDNGEAERVIGTHLDITEKMRLQTELEENEFRLDAATNGANLGVWDINLQSGSLYVNNRWFEMLGYPPNRDDSTLDFFFRIVHPDDKDRLSYEIRRIEGGGRNNFEMMLRLRDRHGKYRHILDKGKVVEFDRAGKAVRVIGTHLDVSGEIQLQEQLKEKEFRLSAAVEGGSIGIWDLDLQSGRGIVNEEWCNIFGYHTENYEISLEQYVDTFIHPEEKDKPAILLDEVSQNGQLEKPVIRRAVHSSGREINVLTKAKVIEYTESGEPKRVVGTHLDVTENFQLQEDLKQSVEEKSILLAEIHHRVKNNLAIIAGILDLKVMESGADRDVQDLQDIGNRIRSIAGVHELLYQSKNFSEINFEKYAKDLAGNLETSLGSGLKVDTHLRIDAGLKININQAVPLGLLLNELIMNSYKHAFHDIDEPEIHFSLHRQDDRYYAVYRDNGPGYSSHKEDRSDSLGLTLIHVLLDQLGANVHMNPDRSNPLTFNFEHSLQGSQATKMVV